MHEWSLHRAETRWGLWALFICAFCEASFIGIPTIMVFIPLVLLNPKMTWKYIIFSLLGTIAGAMVGYAIGHFVWISKSGEFTGLARFMFDNIPGFSEIGYEKIRNLYANWDFWILFVSAALPLPFKIFSISSGVFNINLLIFVIATLLSQGIKFGLLALFTLKLGPRVKKLFEYNWKPVIIIATATIAITILMIKIF